MSGGSRDRRQQCRLDSISRRWRQDCPIRATCCRCRTATSLGARQSGWDRSGSKETAGASGGPPQRITLLRDADGDGKPELKTVLLDHLNSPFGIAVLNGALYVADTDAVLRFPFTPGQTRITAPGEKVIDLPGGLIDHHWTKSLTVSPDGSKF